MTFTTYGISDIEEGYSVNFRKDGQNVFFGFIFDISSDKSKKINITAYDQLRYLKNKLDPKNTKEEKNTKTNNDKEKEKNDDSQLVFDKERILRKYNSEFILTVEKSILSFNVKNFKDSYEVLKNSEIIKNVKEYGEFLLVVSGFDKFLIGEFLAKQKYPNDKKEVLNNFIESINMKFNEISFFFFF